MYKIFGLLIALLLTNVGGFISDGEKKTKVGDFAIVNGVEVQYLEYQLLDPKITGNNEWQFAVKFRIKNTTSDRKQVTLKTELGLSDGATIMRFIFKDSLRKGVKDFVPDPVWSSDFVPNGEIIGWHKVPISELSSKKKVQLLNTEISVLTMQTSKVKYFSDNLKLYIIE